MVNVQNIISLILSRDIADTAKVDIRYTSDRQYPHLHLVDEGNAVFTNSETVRAIDEYVRQHHNRNINIILYSKVTTYRMPGNRESNQYH